MSVNNAPCHPGQTAAHNVDDGLAQSPLIDPFLKGSSRVRRFARLADGDQQSAIVQQGPAIAELGAQVDLNRQATHAFDHVLPNQAGMVRGPAGNQNDLGDLLHLGFRKVQLVEAHSLFG